MAMMANGLYLPAKKQKFAKQRQSRCFYFHATAQNAYAI
jgi:hypothetical protein